MYAKDASVTDPQNDIQVHIANGLAIDMTISMLKNNNFFFGICFMFLQRF